jgi:cytidylate kinase
MPAPPPTGPTEVVAIDGPSGAGKSTIAKALARRLGYAYLDTGAMYRAVTWHFLEQQCAPAQIAGDPVLGERRMREVLARTELQVLPDGRVLLQGRDVSGHLRSREVEHQVSAVSALPFVRHAMRELQRRLAAHGPLVAEGRDMASVVFPDARWKIYLDARPEERARRRQRDFEARGRPISEREVLEEIEVRDRLDRTRQDAPLLRAPDAHHLDSTGLDAEAVVESILTWMGRGDHDAGRKP